MDQIIDNYPRVPKVEKAPSNDNYKQNLYLFPAVKANDYLPVLKVFAKLGSGFDCASKGEMEKVLSIGVEPERIIYANPTKDPTHIQYAAENGIYLMTFDSETELYKIKNICPQAKFVIVSCCLN